MDERFVDVSHGLGIPLGGIGTGYSVFGKYGFVRVNFDSTPDKDSFEYPGYGPQKVWDYLAEPEKGPAWAFVVTEGDRGLFLQETPLHWYPRPHGRPVDKVHAYAHLPKGFFRFDAAGWDLGISMTAFSPLIPHDLANSTLPVQVFDVTLENRGSRTRVLRLELLHRDPVRNYRNKAVYADAHGQIAFGCEGGRVESNGISLAANLAAGEAKTLRFFVAWFYPKFKTPSATAPDIYKRYYAKSFSCAMDVVNHAFKHADYWSWAIDQWHESLAVPPEFHRLWFSSLSSVICSTMLSDDPYFFEIETPHRHVNTMDVGVYSSWLYLVNWPELERMEMDQYVRSIFRQGPHAGLVWHSLWKDAAQYAEEPIFLTRVYRDFLWFRDQEWLQRAFPAAAAAANRVYKAGNHEHLIKSTHGNQSYDVWKMPGVSAFVNSAWVYGLYALEKMANLVQASPRVDGISAGELRVRAAESFDRILWNEAMGYWNCFLRTPDAVDVSVPETAFTDQLFGKWVVAIDPGSAAVLPAAKVERALETLYRHNLIDDPARGFRGWVNGLLPGRKKEPSDQYHAFVCWICAQLDLGSLLGEIGDEAACLDVFRSLEASLHNHHLAVGEWNQSIDDELKTRTLPEEPGKDTPRFPPYPRYKCAWEYLVRILGLKMDAEYFYLRPFKAFDFGLRNIRLAGTTFTVTVSAGWTKVLVDGSVVDEARIPRETKELTVAFVP